MLRTELKLVRGAAARVSAGARELEMREGGGLNA